MTTRQRMAIQQALQLARRVEATLAPLAYTGVEPDTLTMRLAQAYALSLLDHLSELAGDDAEALPATSPGR